jgi:hypothetical protein
MRIILEINLFVADDLTQIARILLNPCCLANISAVLPTPAPLLYPKAASLSLV